MTKAKKETTQVTKNSAGKKSPMAALRIKAKRLKTERSHRSFQLTKRRDYKKPPYVEGYLAFTQAVLKVVWGHKRLFGTFIVVYSVVMALFVGMTSHENYRLVGEYVDGVMKASNSGPVAEASVLFGLSLTGTLTDIRSEGQQLFAGFILLFGWLVIVWLLRQSMAGHTVKLRDGLYSAGAPLVSTVIIAVVILIQALPFLIGLLVYSFLASVGLFDSGVEAMLAWVALILLAAMSLYWITASLVSLVIVTLPGMFPFVALKKASELVAGYRVSLMMRVLWALFVLAVLWVVVLLPLILIDVALNTQRMSLVPVAMLFLSSWSVVWFSSYVYILYRRLIDSEKTASA